MFHIVHPYVLLIKHTNRARCQQHSPLFAPLFGPMHTININAYKYTQTHDTMHHIINTIWNTHTIKCDFEFFVFVVVCRFGTTWMSVWNVFLFIRTKDTWHGISDDLCCAVRCRNDKSRWLHAWFSYLVKPKPLMRCVCVSVWRLWPQLSIIVDRLLNY